MIEKILKRTRFLIMTMTKLQTTVKRESKGELRKLCLLSTPGHAQIASIAMLRTRCQDTDATVVRMKNPSTTQ